MILPLVVIIASAIAVGAGIYLTVRGFKASAARAVNGDVHTPSTAASTVITRHDPATTELLKRFFDGKVCAICKRLIPPVQRTGPKPGLLNSTTHQTYSWDHIPHENLSSVLETHSPLCPTCQVAESFRQRHPDLVVDRDRSQRDAHAPNRIVASS